MWSPDQLANAGAPDVFLEGCWSLYSGLLSTEQSVSVLQEDVVRNVHK